MDDTLRARFCEGFYSSRPAGWIEKHPDNRLDESERVVADIAGCLSALASGQRDFSYPRHDQRVFELLQRIVPQRRLTRGADIGCATGCFPAMQLAAGIERCTVFEVRPVEVNDDRVEVRVQDLTYAEDVEADFDLVTCLSTIEHVGLGRYGDQLDPWGDIKMAANLRRILRPGGVMLISFPIGPGCVVYDAHRIYSPERRSALFGDLTLVARPRWTRHGQWRGKLAVALRKAGAFWQPIYVLEKPR